MEKHISGPRQKTFLEKLVVPIMLVLMLQIIIFASVLLLGNLLPQIEENALDTLDSRVELRAQYLESEMIHRWSNLEEDEERILSLIDEILAGQGAGYEDIGTDPQLNSALVSGVAEELVYMLRKNTVTGAYIILNGPGTAADVEKGNLAGFYVRDMDPTSYSSQNEDLLVERGLPSIIKNMQLAMDSFWTISFDSGDPVVREILLRPMWNALEQPGKRAKEYAGWSPSFYLSEGDAALTITYGLPLISDSGEVFGVMGISLMEHYMQSMLRYDELQENKTGAYFLGISRDGGETYEKVFSNGPAYQVQMGDAKNLSGQKMSYGHIYSFRSRDGRKEYYGSCWPLKLYDGGASYEEDRWALIGLADRDVLLGMKEALKRSILVTSMIFLGLGAASVYLASRTVTEPLRRVANNVASASPDQKISLEKVHIKELDQVLQAVEKMSGAVADEASKFSRVIELAGVPIGAFEYSREKELVYCSRFMAKLLGWKTNGEYIPKEEFAEKMKEFETHWVRELLFRFSGENGQNLWIQLRYQLDEDGCLGVVLDVTDEVLEKQKIEYERDYDLLTNIYNRRAFMERITEIFREPKNLRTAALLMFDLDSLKYVNDTYGHEYGDAYICVMAEKLREFESRGGIISRRSGDEFYAFLYGYRSRQELQKEIDLLWEHILEGYIMVKKGKKFALRVSAGITWYPDDSDSFEELMRFSDYAMYESKRAHRSELCQFSREHYDENKDSKLE